MSANPVLLTTERLVLRRPDPADIPAWSAFFCSGRARYIGGGEEAGAGRAWRAFAALIGHWVIRGCGTFVLTRHDEDTPLGNVGPWYPGDWPEREIGWTIWSPDAEGRGYAFEAAAAIRDHVFRNLGWTTAVSYIDPANVRSIALAERLGAVRDTGAAKPGEDTLVYRHSPPEMPDE